MADSSPILRLLVGSLGAGTVVFGLAPIAAPGFFAALFGLPCHDQPAATVAIRSVGVRDLANGIGLLATLNRPDRNLPWLVLRCASDSGDALACWLAVAGDPDNGRLKSLAALASAAALIGGGLLAWSSKRQFPLPLAGEG